MRGREGGRSHYPIEALDENFDDHATSGDPAVLIALLEARDAVQRDDHVLLRMRFGAFETQITATLPIGKKLIHLHEISKTSIGRILMC